MTAHELCYQQSYSYQGIYEALSGLPVDVSFINFDDIINNSSEKQTTEFYDIDGKKQELSLDGNAIVWIEK
jgi:hypothetical protein